MLIRNYEPRQVRKKAAISSVLCGNVFSIQRPYYICVLGVIKCNTQLYTENLDQQNSKKWYGQEHITRTLKNQIVAGRVGHAYLFNGGRGTGKTSSAKILARAINCTNSQDGEPCNECDVCKAMLEGTLTDVVEMDAASNNSVEDIRSIREEVNFLPTIAKYRVYIIDEVHMLSTGAFNALLKTLEEPPEHVKFILATTEPQKLPATILSRCQRFDFKKISDENVIKRLKIICAESNIEITDEALKLIAVLSEGAMRDSISILERCVQDSDGQVTEDKIKELVGIPKIEHIADITQGMIEKNADKALETINKVIEEGKDLNNLLWEIIKYIKDILVYKSTGKLDIYSPDEVDKIKSLAEKVSKDALLKLIYNLSELENTMKWSTQRTIMFEAGIIKNCIEIQTENLEQRIEKLEDQIKSGNIKIASVPKTDTVAKPAITVAQQKPQAQNVAKRVISQPGEYVSYWNEVINKLKSSGKIMLYTNLLNTKAKEAGDTLQIEFKNGLTAFGKTVLTKPESMNDIANIANSISGKQFRIKYVEETATAQEDTGINLDGLDIPINIIEE